MKDNRNQRMRNVQFSGSLRTSEVAGQSFAGHALDLQVAMHAIFLFFRRLAFILPRSDLILTAP
jgi:hypothetical protein